VCTARIDNEIQPVLVDVAASEATGNAAAGREPRPPTFTQQGTGAVCVARNEFT